MFRLYSHSPHLTNFSMQIYRLCTHAWLHFQSVCVFRIWTTVPFLSFFSFIHFRCCFCVSCPPHLSHTPIPPYSYTWPQHLFTLLFATPVLHLTHTPVPLHLTTIPVHCSVHPNCPTPDPHTHTHTSIFSSACPLFCPLAYTSGRSSTPVRTPDRFFRSHTHTHTWCTHLTATHTWPPHTPDKN